jgi:hypothetical protein
LTPLPLFLSKEVASFGLATSFNSRELFFTSLSSDSIPFLDNFLLLFGDYIILWDPLFNLSPKKS